LSGQRRGRGEGAPMFPPLQVTAETGDWQGGLEDTLDFNTPSLGEFEGVGGPLQPLHEGEKH
jgi:hypothetical protein